MSDMFGSFDEPLSLVLHVTQHEGRSLEQLLAPRRLGDDGPSLGGAVIQASYVHRDPPLLLRLADGHIPWVVEPQSVRFASAGYASVASIAQLPYAPHAPLDPTRFTDEHRRMVRTALEFQARHEPAMYVVPSLPVARPSARVLNAFQALHEFAATLNGSAIPYRPMLATAYPGIAVLRGRYSVFERLADRSWAGVYVQPLQLDTKRDGVEKLVAYVRFLLQGQQSGLHVIAGRPGAFGLLLGAFGIDLFDCGLGGGDSFSLSRLDRPRLRDETGQLRGGRARPVYLRPLMSALRASDAGQLLDSPAIRSQLACDVGECRFGGYRYAVEDPRTHFFHSRQAELRALRDQRTASLRVQLVNGWLQDAIGTGRLVNRVRGEVDLDPIDFAYLDRWRGVLSRIASLVAVGGS
jgi:hypothetical protein